MQMRHRMRLRSPELPANMAWGDADGRTLYLTALTRLYRVRLNVASVRREPMAKAAAD